MKFKSGDKVVCIDNAGAEDCFRVGAEYTVSHTEPAPLCRSGQLVYCVETRFAAMFGRRFTLAKTQPPAVPSWEPIDGRLTRDGKAPPASHQLRVPGGTFYAFGHFEPIFISDAGDVA